jgi:acetyl esterase
MPLHPQAKALLDQIQERGRPSVAAVPVVEARRMVEEWIPLQAPPVPPAEVHHTVTRTAGGELPVRVYRPTRADDGSPLLVYFHGGGWMTGSLDLIDRPLHHLAQRSRAVVASVGYRLAPETKFPGPAEDCHAAVVDLARRAVEWSADPDKVIVAGDSAGANLAAATSLMARDRRSVPICGQVLIYPALIPPSVGGFRSMADNGADYLLTREALDVYWGDYLSSPADATHPYAAPLRATDLSGLPSAVVLTAEYDPLRDEGEEFARRLAAAGVDVVSHRYDGAIHGFFWMPGVLEVFDTAVADIAGELRRLTAPKAGIAQCAPRY